MAAIRANHEDGKPFLAYLAFTAPHDPVQVPEPWRSKYRGRYEQGYEILRAERIAATRELGLIPDDAPAAPRYPQIPPWSSLDEEQRALQARGMEVYAGMVENLDHHLGRVLAFLEEIGELEDTVILLFSDNGPNPWVSEDYPGNREGDFMDRFDNSLESIGSRESGYAYGMGFAAASAGPLDRFKMTVAQGGIRSPMVIAGPGVDGVRRVSSFCYVTDIMPTLLELCGLEHPATFGGRDVAAPIGRSLVPLLAGTSQAVYSPEDVVGGEAVGGMWVRQGDYKAVSVGHPYGSGEWHLFDLESDPGETRDLASEQPEVLARLREAWAAYAEEVGVVSGEG
jgi:arylsulfatase